MFTKPTIIADASSESVKIALTKNNEIVCELTTDAPALESFSQAMNDICKDFSEIGNYAICTGPGSMLGERFASVFISTLARINNAKIFEWDAMKVAAYSIFDSKKIENFLLLAPSRKDWVNILKMSNGKIEFEREIEISNIPEDDLKILLHQRKNPPAGLSDIAEFSPTPTTIFNTLKLHPELLGECDLPPDAKSLTKREYVKWKAQAHI